VRQERRRRVVLVGRSRTSIETEKREDPYVAVFEKRGALFRFLVGLDIVYIGAVTYIVSALIAPNQAFLLVKNPSMLWPIVIGLISLIIFDTTQFISCHLLWEKRVFGIKPHDTGDLPFPILTNVILHFAFIAYAVFTAYSSLSYRSDRCEVAEDLHYAAVMIGRYKDAHGELPTSLDEAFVMSGLPEALSDTPVWRPKDIEYFSFSDSDYFILQKKTESVLMNWALDASLVSYEQQYRREKDSECSTLGNRFGD
jgi:hypothetical protein